jgi:hypothetical protein
MAGEARGVHLFFKYGSIDHNGATGAAQTMVELGSKVTIVLNVLIVLTREI